MQHLVDLIWQPESNRKSTKKSRPKSKNVAIRDGKPMNYICMTCFCTMDNRGDGTWDNNPLCSAIIDILN